MIEIQKGIQTLMDAYNIPEEQAGRILDTPIVDSRMIALIAAKRKFNPEKERRYIEKAKVTKCRCKHWTQTNPCFYHTCRHSIENHYGLEEVREASQ